MRMRRPGWFSAAGVFWIAYLATLAAGVAAWRWWP